MEGVSRRRLLMVAWLVVRLLLRLLLLTLLLLLLLLLLLPLLPLLPLLSLRLLLRTRLLRTRLEGQNVGKGWDVNG